MNVRRIQLVPMEIKRRVERLRALFDEAECDALLISNLTNIRYLTGFTGSAALLLVRDDELMFVSDGRYQEQAVLELDAAGVEARIEISSTKQRSILTTASKGVTRLGLEAGTVTWAEQREYGEKWFPGAKLVPTAGVVERLRLVKDEGEVSRIVAAADIADAALAEVRPSLADEPTETEFSFSLDSAMRRLGASGVAFETIIAAGPNAAMPHARPGPRRIVSGDLVVMDFGAMVDGYRSDMTRTVVVGEPDETQVRMLDTVLEAQALGVEAVRPGASVKSVDAACRNHISRAGWADAFVHGTGHGVGLDIHEGPRVSKQSDATLETGHVVTVEPGIYFPDHGGVRIEDTVLVTPEGCRTLTKSAKTTTVV